MPKEVEVEDEVDEQVSEDEVDGDFGSVDVLVEAIPVHRAAADITEDVSLPLKEGETPEKAIARYRGIIEERIMDATDPKEPVGWIKVGGTLYNLAAITTIHVNLKTPAKGKR